MTTEVFLAFVAGAVVVGFIGAFINAFGETK